MRCVRRSDPDELSSLTYAEVAKLDSFKINAGDEQGVLTGNRLDEVNSFDLNGIRFVPAKLARRDQEDELHLSVATPASAGSLQPDEKLTAKVDLKDGRVLDLQTTVAQPRPKVELISKSVQPSPTRFPVHLANQNELPLDGVMSFVVKAEIPEIFSRTERIEVANDDSSLHVLLSASDGDLLLQNSDTALAVLNPLKSFGPAAFGPLRFRTVEDKEGGQGDWQPLAMLVRVPSLKEVRCQDSPDRQCKLNGSDLFLIDSVASDPQFNHTVSVPIGFVESTLSVPRPNGTLLYIRLRDDPSTHRYSHTACTSRRLLVGHSVLPESPAIERRRIGNGQVLCPYRAFKWSQGLDQSHAVKEKMRSCWNSRTISARFCPRS